MTLWMHWMGATTLAVAMLQGGAAVPSPVLTFTGSEAYSANGKAFVRYRFDVSNKDQFPEELFDPAPDLPPCGRNTNSSRTWVDFFDSKGQRLYGFCALTHPGNLNTIWFSVETGKVPPSWVYIEMTDRQTNRKYRSNLAETVL